MTGKKILKLVLGVGLMVAGFCTASVFAANDIGSIANTVTGAFSSIVKLMTAAAYLAGFGMTIAAIFKFKQHKDNPQQVQMGVPITMLLVGVLLIFLPNIIAPAGASIFGGDAKTGGITGSGFSSAPGADTGTK
jgi:intracellular multiplication protein IcmD